MNVPCKDCPDRTADCHSKCEKYIDYSKEVEKVREQRAKYQSMRGSSPGKKAEMRRKFQKRRK